MNSKNPFKAITISTIRHTAALLLTLAISLPTHAAVKTWVGTGGTGNWSTASNWSPSGAPAAGDDLSFPAGASGLVNTNNLTRNFSSITFSGAAGGYVLRGNPIALTNGITAANTSGANTIELTITNGANQTVTATTGGTLSLNGDIVLSTFNLTVNNSAVVNLAGVVSGAGGLTKNGSGNLLLNGATNNTFTGMTTVNNGTLELNDVAGTSVNMVPGDLTINTSGTVLLSEGNQIADGADVTINGAGLLNLNNFSETINSLTFGGTGSVTTGTGTLTNGNITANGSTTAPTITGNLHLGSATRTISVTNATSTLTISAVVKSGNSGSPLFIPAGFIKNGPGTLVLSGANTYGGISRVDDGTLDVRNTLALGASGAALLFNNPTTQVNSNGVLLLNNAHITNEVLTLNSVNTGGALQVNATGDWIGPITLSTNVVIEASSLLQLGGVIDGPGGFTKISTSTLRMVGSDVNTYAGTTIVNAGTLELNRAVFDGSIPGDLVIGDGVGSDTVRLLTLNQIANTSHVSINFGGKLDLNGLLDGIGDLEFTGGAEDAGTSTLILFTGGVTVNAHTNTATMDGGLSLNGVVRTFDIADGVFFNPDLQINGPITSGGITKIGNGTMLLAGTNTYTGLTTVSNGTLEVSAPGGLGSTNSGTVLANFGILQLDGVTITGEPLTNNASVFSELRASGGGAWTGNIVMNDYLVVAGYTLNLSGAISGNGPLEISAGNENVVFSGSAANTYTNRTIVRPGATLQLNKTVVNGAIPGDLTFQYLSKVQLLANNQIADTAKINITNEFGYDGVLDLNGFTETVGSVNGSGLIDLGGGTLRAGNDNGTATFSGLITNSGTLFKLGLGTWTLTGSNTYTGVTTVSAGTLVVNGVQPQSPVTVNGTATLEGSGTVGEVFVFGNLKPGTSPGMLTCSNLTFFSSASDYFVELTGPNAGTDYDQMNVRGTNSLASATLHLTTAFTTPVAVGQAFMIIKNDKADAITGTFNGLAEGATISSGAYKFTISYVGGTGNDVVLTLTDVPSGILSADVTAGNGNHIIDPNECNSLNLVITNTSGLAMNGITATLSTTNERVIITQPYSTYPNLAMNARGTNVTPFQISTHSGYTCGQDIQLTLAVNSSTLGAFVMPLVLHSGVAAATPLRYDNNTATSIPDVGSIDSTNTVSLFTNGPLEKVAVSAYITHTKDSDLSLQLVSPDGTTVLLVTNAGAGADFGTGSADVARTTFDDSAATSITAGTSPFVGTFRPMGALTNFIYNSTVNGDWKLHIVDKLGGTLGTLRNWSLFLYPVTCTDGGGNCDYCLNPTNTALSFADLVLTNRANRNGIRSSCAFQKAWPGIELVTNVHYEAHSFTNNSGADACVTVVLTAAANLQSVLYLDSFDPSNLSSNYLADSGQSTGGGSTINYSAEIPAGAKFVVVVNDTLASALIKPYTLQLSGLPCPTPTLDINPAAATNSVRVHWPTWAGGFLLESNRSLTTTNWVTVTNEPLVNAGRFNVTNRMNPTNAFFRLKKP